MGVNGQDLESRESETKAWLCKRGREHILSVLHSLWNGLCVVFKGVKMILVEGLQV